MANYQIDDIVEVKVNALRNYGALVSTLDDVKGLLHISEISDLFVANIADFVKVGDTMKMKIIDIDQTSQFLKFSLKQVSPVGKKAKKRRQHEKISSEEIDFKPLKEMLPIWIAKAKEQEHD